MRPDPCRTGCAQQRAALPLDRGVAALEGGKSGVGQNTPSLASLGLRCRSMFRAYSGQSSSRTGRLRRGDVDCAIQAGQSVTEPVEVGYDWCFGKSKLMQGSGGLFRDITLYVGEPVVE